MSELITELRQAKQDETRLEQLLASNKAECSISQKEKYDSYVPDHNAKIAALIKEKEANTKSMKEKISGLENLNNDCYMKLQTVKRRIKL